MTPIPRDLELTVNPPEEIGTILDVDRRLIGSTHEVYSYISKEQLDQLNTLKWGRRYGEGKNGKEEKHGGESNQTRDAYNGTQNRDKGET